MADTIIYLSYLVSILLIGLLCAILAKRFSISNVFLLLISGILIAHFPLLPRIAFTPLFLESIGIIALVMIVFDACARFKLREFSDHSTEAVNLAFIFLFFNLTIMTLATWLLIGFPLNIHFFFVAMIFAAVMSGTSPDVVLSMFGNNISRAVELLKVESILNTPFTVLIPFIILDLIINLLQGQGLPAITNQIGPLLTQVITGVGTGILIGIIIFKFMSRYYSETLSPLAIIIAALLSYVLAQQLGGNGVLAVTTLGLFFGSIRIKEKISLMGFSSIFSNALEILLFVLLGYIINFPLTFQFIFKSVILFTIYLAVRYLSVKIALKGTITRSEQWFLTLNVSKGIPVAVVTFSLSSLTNIAGISELLNYILVFILYSILLSTITTKYLHPVQQEKKGIQKRRKAPVTKPKVLKASSHHA